MSQNGFNNYYEDLQVSSNADIETIERVLGREAEKQFMPMQPGDVETTYADVADLIRDTGYKPNTKLEDGIRQFMEWYLEYYQVGMDISVNSLV